MKVSYSNTVARLCIAIEIHMYLYVYSRALYTKYSAYSRSIGGGLTVNMGGGE